MRQSLADFRRPILVSGSVRSGTTWVGRMIAKAPAVGYIHEPFNRWENQRRLGAFDAPVAHRFLYVGNENKSLYHDAMRETLGFRYKLMKGLRRSSLKDLSRLFREYTTFSAHRIGAVRPLVKDPFALFSAEWFAGTFDAAIIIMIRHPAAVVSSIKRLGWGSLIPDLLQQPLLMSGLLRPFEAKLEEFEASCADTVDQSILLWNILYHVVAEYRDRHENWIFLRHEDVSRDPVSQFRQLFASLDLEFSPQIEQAIRQHSQASNPTDVNLQDNYSLRRNSRAAICNWKNRLAATEIERIRKGTWDVARRFYTEADW